jgi:hypothetical protein
MGRPAGRLTKIREFYAERPQGDVAFLVGVVDDLLVVLRDAVSGLSKGACFTCGSEPGCNIDCAGCLWISRAEDVIAKAEDSE